MNIGDMESQDGATSGQSTQSSKKRIRSRCWLSFEKLPPLPDGSIYARCNKCGKKLSNNPGSGTINLVRHHDSCGALSISSSAVEHSTFSHEKFCELIIEAVVKHDLPFRFVEYEGIRAAFDYVAPGVHLPSRNTAKNHVMKMYEIERLKMKDLLSKSKGRICLTSDLWSSQTADGYLALTAHFLDHDWNLQKKVLNFSHMPPPHTGNALAEKISFLIHDWGIDKNLFSITLDNASANDSFVEKLKTQLNFRKLLLMDGQFFHVRCCAQILNLIVQDGLKIIDVSVTKVRDCVKYIKGPVARKHKFLECVQHVEITGNRRALRQDVSTRWNSTYLMLESALYYRQALGQYALVEADFKSCPTSEEWDRIKMISKFLGEFYEVTCLFSGSKYVTSNLFFPKVFKIQHSIREAKLHIDEFMKQMGNVMSVKFDKYWSDYSLILGIAVVMDPRYKLNFVEWAYDKLYGYMSDEFEKFTGALESLFDEYKTIYSDETDLGVQLSEGCSYSQDEDPLFQAFDAAYKEGTRSSIDNELSIYLKEQKLERTAKVDVLSWWKAEQFRYPILCRLACDILTIPISTVASESAFSTGGRVLDQYQSSLLPETAEALLCCRDWLFGKKCEDSVIEDAASEDALDMNIV